MIWPSEAGKAYSCGVVTGSNAGRLTVHEKPDDIDTTDARYVLVWHPARGQDIALGFYRTLDEARNRGWDEFDRRVRIEQDNADERRRQIDALLRGRSVLESIPRCDAPEDMSLDGLTPHQIETLARACRWAVVESHDLRKPRGFTPENFSHLQNFILSALEGTAAEVERAAAAQRAADEKDRAGAF